MKQAVINIFVGLNGMELNEFEIVLFMSLENPKRDLPTVKTFELPKGQSI
jgi:hypothetical protein